ncbi:MAG TPA: hypothetical protein VFC90_14115 [Planctomycetota bacterium]|nr:hypothetical protein [Planctomycetota bacterium]
MTKLATISLAAALMCGWTPAQDMGGGAQEEKACDLSKTEQRDYCAGCKTWPAADQIEKGACKKCKGKVEKAETCVKVCWVCPKMHGGQPKRHSKDCCGVKGCCTETPILALVWYVCDGCQGKAMKEADVKHAGEKCEGKIKKTCAESNKFPHGGTE